MRGVLLIALALFDLFALARASRSISRGVSAHRRIVGADAGARAARDRGAAGRGRRRRAPAGVLRRAAAPARVRLRGRAGAPRARTSWPPSSSTRRHHAARRDPLRILIARAIGDAYSFGALPRREQALAELAADAAAVRSRGAAPLAVGAAGLPRRLGADRARARGPAHGRSAGRRGPARAGGRRGRRDRGAGRAARWPACSSPATRASACRWPPRRSGGCARSPRGWRRWARPGSAGAGPGPSSPRAISRADAAPLARCA